ncbi:substrate-binding domain-containing protein [Schaalia sp. lx-260]|uniref:substrate-binding domain-containing protein n=1 Tax=Schaalia sp. lx-260 TaxID=2899082 RepID=UPI001E4A1919|nr:substrate-binding domain-containing protein [Schaalia sp. lx-260]MCD4548941.1 substrate-binding domain-containing protein [Schaalia sp. lx-260]
MTRHHTATLIAAAVATLALSACSPQGPQGNSSPMSGSTASNTSTQVVNIVKLSGGDWFNRMDIGNKEYAAEHGISVTQTAGDDASEEKQIAIINDLIAQKPTAMTIIPNSPESLENVIARAKSAGIIIVTGEASGMKGVDADIEAFVNQDYGAHQLDKLAECMDQSGQYAHFVGSLTVKSHNEWVEGANAHLSAYPNMTNIGEPISSDESQETAYQRTKEILARYPDIKGFIGSASTDIAGIGRAIQEAGKQNSTCVVGTSTPAIIGKLIEDGSVDVITGWDPALQGKAMLAAVQKILNGEQITDGADLGISGYNKIKQDKNSTTTFYGNAWIDITKENTKDYPF